jgi:hypothetical protein
MNTPVISQDGYIRLWPGTLDALALKHLFSGLDADLAPPQHCTARGVVSGYTEWVSEGKPAISVGWDWQVQLTHLARPRCMRAGLPRSNLMLVDATGQDLGADATSLYLAQWLDTHAVRSMLRPWQAQVADACNLA